MQVLVIGLGSIAKKHIHALRTLYPGCGIQALRSGASPDTIEGVENINSLAAAAKPDFIIVSNPTAFHRETIEQVMTFDVPLFIEKPVFHEAGHAEEKLVGLLSTRIPTYVACNLRFHPAIRFVKNYLSQVHSRIDEVTAYCGSHLPSWRPGTDFRSGYSADPARGGGVHLDLIHELDYLCYLLGLPERTLSVKMNRSSLHIDAVDSARYLLQYPDFSVGLSLNYFRKKPERTLEIVREHDIINVDLLQATVTDTHSGKILFERPGYSMLETYSEQLAYFVDNKSGKLMNDVEEAFAILKIALS